MMLMRFGREALAILVPVTACLLASMGKASAANTPPSIAPIVNQTVYVDHPALFKLYVTDPETPTNNLQLSLTSNNSTLVPLTNVVFHYFLFDADGPHWYITVTPAFGVTGSATCTVFVSDGTNTVNTSFVLTVSLPSGAARFVNNIPISFPPAGTASAYPSTNLVSGRTGTITNMTLTLSRIYHDYVTDLHMLLVGPTGKGMVVFSRVSAGPVINGTATLTDASPYVLPPSFGFELWSEQFKACDWSTSDAYSNNFPAPAPPMSPGPYGAVSFSNSFNGLPANGKWSLYIYDDSSPSQGSILGGWSLMISTSGGANSVPTISDITNRSTSVNTATAPIPFNINDVDTAPDFLVLTAGSSNPTLVPTNNIVFGGSGSNRTVTVTPSANQIGNSTITVTVSDGVTNRNDSLVLTVEKGQLTVTGITAGNKVYDSTTTATLNVSGATLQGVVGSPDVTLNTSGASGTFDNKNVGTGRVVQVAGLALSGAHSSNYVLTQPTTTAAITARALTLTGLTAQDKVYDGGTTASISSYGTLTGVVSPDVVTLDTSAAAASFDTEDVGSNKTVTVISLALSGADSANYTIGSQNTLANIIDGPRLLSISESPEGTFILEWQVYPGRAYRFEYKNSLSATDWTPLSTNTAPSSSVAITNNADTNIHRIYRALDVTVP